MSKKSLTNLDLCKYPIFVPPWGQGRNVKDSSVFYENLQIRGAGASQGMCCQVLGLNISLII